MSSELYGGQDPIALTEGNRRRVVLHPDDVTVVTDDQGRTVGYEAFVVVVESSAAELRTAREAAVRLHGVIDDLAYWADGGAKHSPDPDAAREVAGLRDQAAKLVRRITGAGS